MNAWANHFWCPHTLPPIRHPANTPHAEFPSLFSRLRVKILYSLAQDTEKN
ncbi:hypothetical protein HDC30_002477 [Pseudomonas sp. JAI115]|nr:hypothetical protein [Pseudomonas sp. JAI115]